MVVMHLCGGCLPEGTDIGLGLLSGPQSHCNGRFDRVIPGVLGGFRCSCTCNTNHNKALNEEEIAKEATLRYLNDAEFAAIVKMAVAAAVPKTINESINKALREAGTRSAAFALIISERGIGK